MKEVDKILKAKLFDHPSELPTDMWSRIEQGLEGGKRRRSGAWIWLANLGVVLMLGIAYATFNFHDEGLVPSDTEVTPTIYKIRGKARDKSFTNQNRSKSPEEILTSTTIEQGQNHSLLPLSNFVSNQSSSSKAGKNLPSIETTITPIGLKSEMSKTSRDENLLSRFKGEGQARSTNHLYSAELHSKEGLADRSSLDEFNGIHTDLPLLKIKPRIFPDPNGCPSFSRKYKPNIFIEAYYQPLLAFSHISPNSSEIGDGYLSLRRNTESRLYSWSAGLNIAWLSDYNVGAKAGLNFEEVNERFTYEDPEAIRNQTVITIDTIFNGDGTFNVSSDTSIVQVSGSEIQRIYNYHRTLNIPIHALYQHNFGNVAIEVSGGPIFNINYVNRGKIVDPSNEDQWFTNNLSGAYQVFKERLSVSFSVSVGLMYAVDEKIQIFARPEVKYHPASMTKVSSPFNQRYLNTGLSLGARYYFSGNPNY